MNMLTTNELALLATAERGEIDKFDALLSDGLSLNVRDSQTNTLLILAAFGGQLAMARHLVSKGADVNEQTVYGLTPLMAAAHNGHLLLAEFLIANGATREAKAHNGQSAYDFAMEKGFNDVAHLLGNLDQPQS